MIKVTCRNCGKHLEAPDGAAGRKGKCPGCGEVFEVPPGRTEGKICGGCKTVYPPEDVICTACGVNLDTGEKIGGQAIAEPAGSKPSGGKLVFEGALSGVLTGVLVFLALLAVEVIFDAIFEGWASASAGLLLRIPAAVVMGAIVGSFVGIVTVVTRSASAGQVLFVIPLGVILFQAWRSGVISGRMPMFARFFALAGIVFSAWLLYVVFGAISQSVLKSINWKKYE